MSFQKKQKITSKKQVMLKNSTIADTSIKSPYSKQNLKKKINEFGEIDAF